MSDPTWVRVLGVQFREDGPWASLRPDGRWISAAQVEQVREERQRYASMILALENDPDPMYDGDWEYGYRDALDWVLALLDNPGEGKG